MRLSDTTILIVPGLNGSGPGHWQRRWHEKLSTSVLVEQEDWSAACIKAWSRKILAPVEHSTKPVVVVAHSMGVLAALHALKNASSKIAAAFLVAPPDQAALQELPSIDPSFLTLQRRALPFPSVLISSNSDPYCSLKSAQNYAAEWGIALIDAGDAGHINVESGHGPWPEGLMSFAGFMGKI
jgi:uncharacterized protein